LSRTLDKATNLVLLVAAVVSCAIIVRREVISSSRSQAAGPATLEPSYEKLKQIGRTTGLPNARLNVLVLSDFECPACRNFERMLRAFMAGHHSEVSYTFVHYPLSYHANAVKAATAAECAADQGRFEQVHNELFDSQDSIAILNFPSLAARNDIADSTAFVQCMMATRQPWRIAEGIASGNTMKVTGTPTVLLNGWRQSRLPSLQQLDSALAVEGRGRSEESIRR